MNTYIITHSGRKLDYLKPDPTEIDLMDISIGLSRQPRFCGHTRHPYSVAMHCLNMYKYGLIKRVPRAVCCWLLLHDAAEAYMCDVPTPLKELLPDYRAIENRILAAVAKRFDLDWPMPAIVRRFDRSIYLLEARLLTKIPARSKITGLNILENIGCQPVHVADHYYHVTRILL